MRETFHEEGGGRDGEGGRGEGGMEGRRGSDEEGGGGGMSAGRVD